MKNKNIRLLYHNTKNKIQLISYFGLMIPSLVTIYTHLANICAQTRTKKSKLCLSDTTFKNPQNDMQVNFLNSALPTFCTY